MEYLVHYGIRGQKWGVRRFQNEDGSLTDAGRRRYGIDGLDRTERSDLTGKAARKAARKERNMLRSQVYNRAEETKNSYRELLDDNEYETDIARAVQVLGNRYANRNIKNEERMQEAAYKEVDDYIRQKYGETTMQELEKQERLVGIGMTVVAGAAAIGMLAISKKMASGPASSDSSAQLLDAYNRFKSSRY